MSEPNASEAAARLRVLVRRTRQDPAYRRGCVEAIGLASQLDTVSLEVENLLAEFIRSGPVTPAEADAFALLAELYLRRGFGANALEAAQKLILARPDDPAAAELLQRSRGQRPDTPAPVAPPPLPPPPARRRVPTRRLGEAQVPAPPRPPASDRLGPGTSVAGRYELIEEIGRGGMSVVYRARDDELGEEVALKFLTGFVDAESEARFKQELKLSRQLLHPNIVRLYDIGLHGKLRFLSMELLSGMDLARVLQSGALPPKLVLGHLIACCAGLQAAHDRGIVHRDIKPANLFVTTSGELKVMDFGIAKLQSGGPRLTSPDLFSGTPAYLAPEQIRGFSAVTPAADLYALGVVAFEMLTGSLPFSDPKPMALLLMHVQERPPRPSDRQAGVPPALDAVVLKLLEKLPSRRFASCRELIPELEEIRRRL